MSIVCIFSMLWFLLWNNNKECRQNFVIALNDSDMSNEIIFKKVDSKVFFQNKVEPDDTILPEEKEGNHEDLSEELFEELATDYNVNEQLEPVDDTLDKDNFGSSGSIPSIPNKIFSGTRNVLKIIGWINDKIVKSNAPLSNISPESGIENQDDYSQGKI